MGKAALAKMNDVVGLAVKYQLTGDKKIPAQLVPMIERLIDQGLKTDQSGHNVGDRMQQVAIAYDCCYDVWPAEIKGKVETYLARAARVIYFDQQQLSGGINWHVCSNWSAPVDTGAAYAGLVLWGGKGPAPVCPN